MYIIVALAFICVPAIGFPVQSSTTETESQDYIETEDQTPLSPEVLTSKKKKKQTINPPTMDPKQEESSKWVSEREKETEREKRWVPT